MRRTLALLLKESFQILRDPSNILIAFVLPSILLFIYSFGISLDYKNLHIGLIVDDPSNEASSLARTFLDTPYFSVTKSNSLQELEELLIIGKIKGIVQIPSYFTRDLLNATEKAPIQVIADGSDPNSANFVQNYAEGAWRTWINLRRIEAGEERRFQIAAVPRFWYNEELESRYFLLPGSIALIMTLIGTLLTALVVAREWERGTMESLMATPVTMREILLSKLIPYYVLGIGSMFFCVIYSTYLIGVPFRGSYLALLIVSSAFLFAALGAGLFISTLAKNQFVAYQAAVVTGFLPAFMLSGFIFEVTSMPKPIELLTYLIPARYFVTSLQTLFLVGNVWPLLIKNILALLLFALVLFFLNLQKSHKRLDG